MVETTGIIDEWVEHQKLAWKSVDIRLKYGVNSLQYQESHRKCIESLENIRRKKDETMQMV